MNITDELREWARLARRKSFTLGDELTAIADRIDAEHEKAIASVMNDALYHANEKDMAELGWVRLPKDAGGEYIHAGDVLTDGEYTFRVDELAAFGDGSWSIRNEDGNAWAACDVTHYHAPTVEDVLREFVTEFNRDDTELCDDEVIERFASRLRLREDA